MRRPQDWPDRLATFLGARADLAFRWGSNDCATFAADAVLTLIGVDPMADIRGRWQSGEQAEAVLAELGGLEVATAERLLAAGCVDCPPAFAQRGDVALFTLANMLTVGIVAGTQLVAPGPDRLEHVPRRIMVRAWAV